MSNSRTTCTEAAETVERLTSEGLIGVSQAALLFGTYRNGKPTHPSTVTRWMTSGVILPNGQTLRLESLRLNGRLATSKPALLRFLSEQQPAADSTATIPSRGPTARHRASEAAGRELSARIG
jgi:hypothetical protein